MPDESVPPRRAIALIGNTVALVLLGLLLLQGPRLFGEDERDVRRQAVATASAERTESERADPEPATAEDDGRTLLLIVVDALRDDTARDAALMPRLAALAARGERTTWWVDLLVPSTIGAIESIVEGRSSPPVRALQDFAARPATSGGWLQTISARGEGVFVAGPDLWTERYGAWIDVARTEAGMPDRVSDMRLTLAGLEALAAASGASNAPRIVVVHLGELDATAHRYGASGAHWRQAARRVDARLGSLVDAAEERSIVVLADHGVTARGGHAGGEAVVRRAPLVVVARPAAADAVTETLARTVRPDEVVRAALGERGLDAERARSDSAASTSVGGGGGEEEGASATRVRRTIAVAAATVVLIACAFVTLAGIGFASRGARPGFGASATFWIAVSLAFAGHEGAGAAVVLTALVGLATLVLVRRRGRRDARAVRGSLAAAFTARPPVFSLLSGVVIAGLAVAAAIATADAPLPAVGPPLVAAFAPAFASAAAGLLGGAWVAHLRTPATAGVALAFVIAATVHLGGETTSLSSVDVRLAHRAAGLVPGGPGIALATPVALLRLAWPFVAVLGGYLLARRRLARPTTTGDRIAFARAFGACQLGAAAVCALCLTRAVEVGSTGALPLAAAGFGGLLREGVAVCIVFPALVFTTPRAAPEGSRAGT